MARKEEQRRIPAALLGALSGLLAREIGLYFPEERLRDLERGIVAASRDLGFDDPVDCARRLLGRQRLERGEVEILASHLTVSETYFFREKASFEALEQHILPELIRKHRDADRRIRIWSAGCATGEEPYSVAILLSRMLPDVSEWNLTILGTDINRRALEKAKRGVYRDWSFRETPPWMKHRYFRKTSEGYEVIEPIKKMVDFAYLNLAEDNYPALLNNTNAMDLIFCRNVLMYFAPDRSERVIKGLHRALVDGGWLLVNPSETGPMLYSDFTRVSYPGAMLYRKDPAAADRSPVSPIRVEELVEQATEPVSAGGWVGEAQVLPAPRSGEMTGSPGGKIPPSGFSADLSDALDMYERGRIAEAAARLSRIPREVVEEALLSGEVDARLAGLMAREHAGRGDLEEALTWSERSLNSDQTNPRTHYLRAAILQEMGKLDDADRALRRALYLDPKFVIAHFALGNLARQRGKTDEANKYLSNALDLLKRLDDSEILPESEGVAAGRLSEIVASMLEGESAA